MEKKLPILVIIVPCYNEEEALPEAAKRLSQKISQLVSAKLISPASAILFVDDGSNDNTWPLIESYHVQNPLMYGGIKLSKNSGGQNALLCGLLFVKEYADISVTIDADLQDDVDAIEKMIEVYLSGSQIVLGVRFNRGNDSFFKRTSARFFYCIMRLFRAGLVENHSDFRLMGRQAVKALAEYGEADLFLRGAVLKLGFEPGLVHYEIKDRLAGKSKYTLQKMLGIASLAFAGIISSKKKHPEFHIERSLFRTGK